MLYQFSRRWLHHARVHQPLACQLGLRVKPSLANRAPHCPSFSTRVPSMENKRPHIAFYYDVASPYSWFAFETLVRYEKSKFWEADFSYHPIFLGGVMHATGNKPPGRNPAKAKYMVIDLARSADYFGLDMRMPQDFERAIMTSLKAQRLLMAVSLKAPEYLVPLTRELWQRNWGRDEEIESLESLRESCNAVSMPEGLVVEIIQLNSNQHIKEALIKQTNMAVTRGAFGAPSIVVSNVLPDQTKCHYFFGSDRFHLIARLIGQKWIGPHPDASLHSKL